MDRLRLFLFLEIIYDDEALLVLLLRNKYYYLNISLALDLFNLRLDLQLNTKIDFKNDNFKNYICKFNNTQITFD
ncbi:hypothetical protein A0H76_2399 [Hepatospora eriocheir]|uniref:Uncharacterized protein n=1 Tax=Hepatospora eriocheir TaxID=1081669 RepID=A0A1X0QJV5_9MICR|nr:hypothetical protein A0H76_2399 [Hepatospora eriocheir]